MVNERTSVVTVTFYDLDKPEMETRANLVLITMTDALNRNCAVYAVDGGSTDSFVQQAKNLGVKVIPQEGAMPGRGISLGQQQAIRYAKSDSNPANYILIEPEKAGLLRTSFDSMIDPIRNGLVDLVVVGRTARSMLTLPPMQRYTESAVNEMWKTLTGIDQDILFAPRIFNSRVAELFLNYQPTRNWDLFQGPMIDAMVAGLKVTPIALDYAYPKEMVDHEVGNIVFDRKRVKQLQELTEFFDGYITAKGISPKH